jgi:hypothetical protein
MNDGKMGADGCNNTGEGRFKYLWDLLTIYDISRPCLSVPLSGPRCRQVIHLLTLYATDEYLSTWTSDTRVVGG